ncbi:HAD-IIIA family hydrolase [Actinocorallia aurantiaca]|uniref:D,D-heptose 1,7-bisphosphate phosphatase n=1 Tax=Actinocorallia aurantiaca TaxID=46204 RepID=A0ABP6H4A8_9ACTN
MNGYSVVIPTLVRSSLRDCLFSLAATWGPPPQEIVLVDDRPSGGPMVRVPGELACLVRVLASRGGGPAAARNLGWRRTRTPWVVFLDDDVLVEEDWCAALAVDLKRAGERVAGVQGRISVPLPCDRPPTDWERVTSGLARARWITADMAYRREALVESGGFDERFPRAFREDADLALRLQADGWELTEGERLSRHPVRPATAAASLRAQAGNADDALMRAVHGPGWHRRAGEAVGRRPRHLAITAAGVLAAVAALAGRRRLARAAALGALAGVGEFAAARILPGPRDLREVTLMLGTSLLIPPAASWHWARGVARSRSARPWPGPAKALLLDRDGTLVHDVPYNGDPDLVEPIRGVREALELARESGLRLAVVSNQSGLASGRFSPEDLEAVNRRVQELLGPFEVWKTCPHGGDEGCACRKPAPGLIAQAAAELGVEVGECVMVGDIGSDVRAARAAGARSVLVPTAQTRREELEGARCAPDLLTAVRFALGEASGGRLWR